MIWLFANLLYKITISGSRNEWKKLKPSKHWKVPKKVRIWDSCNLIGLTLLGNNNPRSQTANWNNWRTHKTWISTNSQQQKVRSFCTCVRAWDGSSVWVFNFMIFLINPGKWRNKMTKNLHLLIYCSLEGDLHILAYTYTQTNPPRCQVDGALQLLPQPAAYDPHCIIVR